MSAPPRDILNPISEGTGSPLDICGVRSEHGIFLKDRTLPVVEWENVNTESPDGEGSTVSSSVPKNPVITADLRVVEPDLPAASNLITNPSFEKDTAGWSPSANVSLASVKTMRPGAAGEHCCRVTSSVSNYGVSTFVKPLSPTRFRLMAKRPLDLKSYRAQLASLGGLGIHLPLGQTAPLTDLSGNGRNGTGGGSITPGGVVPGPLSVDDGGATDFDGINDYVGAPAYTSRRNLCPNPNFESGIAGWTSGGSYRINAGASLLHTNASPIYDTWGMRITTVAGIALQGAEIGTIPVVAGRTYTMSVYMIGPAGTFDLSVGDGTVGAGTGPAVVMNGTLKRLTVTWTATGTGTTAIAIRQNEGGNPARVVFVDGVLFENAGAAGAYFPTVDQLEAGKAGFLGPVNASASDIGLFANGTTRTFSGWAKRDGSSAIHTLIGGTNNGQNGIFLRLLSGGNNVQFFPNDGSAPTTWAAAWPGNGVWVHWALKFVANGSGPNNVELFIDGASVGAATQPAQFASGSSLEIGSWAQTAAQFFDGKMAEVAVHERGLSSAEIADLAASGRPFITVYSGSTPLGRVSLTSGDWTQIDFPVPAGPQILTINPEIAAPFDIDAVSVGVDEYFDGDTPGCKWSGVPHASISTRPMSGGDRFWAIVGDLQKTVQRIKRRGGTYRHTPPNGTSITYDLVDARITGLPEDRSAAHFRCEPTIEFECRPFGRLPSTTLAPVTGANLLTIPIPDVAGSAPALGSLKITEPNTADRYFAMWGMRHRYLDTEPLEFTTASMSMVAATVSSGIATATLLAEWMPLLSISGSHAGTYRVWGVTSMSSTAELAFEYGIDDARRTTRLPSVSGISPSQSIVDFGQIIIPEGSSGWKGQLMGRGSGATMGLSRIWLQPVAECAGKAESESFSSSNKLVRADGFVGLGELNSAAMGYSTSGARTWVTTAARFQKLDGYVSSLSAAAGEILAQASATGGTPESFAGVGVNVNVRSDAAGVRSQMGVFARRAGSNHVYAFMSSFTDSFHVLQVGFTKTGAVASAVIPGIGWSMVAAGRLRIEMTVLQTGVAVAVVRDTWSGQILAKTGLYDADLATGGTNATGTVGITDTRFAAGAQPRSYSNFGVVDLLASNTDLVVAKNAGIRVTHKGLDRLDNAGARVGGYPIEGDFLRIPPSGREKTPSEVSVLISRSIPRTAVAHSVTDQATATFTITPRVLLLA